MKSDKQLAFARYVSSRWSGKWRELDETTQLALKQAWYAGWAAQQWIAAKNKKADTRK